MFIDHRYRTCLIGLGFSLVGSIALFIPGLVYTLILDLAFVLILLNGIFFLIRSKKHFSWSSLVFGILSLAFAGILFLNHDLPEWIIRVSFGAYCLLVGIVLFLQQWINLLNFYQIMWHYVILLGGYIALGCTLLFTPNISSKLLMRFFGVYFLLLGFRYLSDALSMERKDYYWKRNLHLSMPVFIAAFIPEWTVRNFNRFIGSIRKKEKAEGDKKNLLQVMVHVGEKGFQKVGHFTFSYKGIVYSYGNYDHQTERCFGLIGDGVFFCVPKDRYLESICRMEKNTIFEYDIKLTDDQERHIDHLIKELKQNSYRWYTPVEKELDNSRWHRFMKDYPSRLHLKTGAKFYKIKRGQFKTYYVFGDNCVLFADRILGVIGADVLSIRGIISPGTYFQYLKAEAEKENSPVSNMKIHPALS